MDTRKGSSPKGGRNYSIIALVVALLACIVTFFLALTRGFMAMQLFSGVQVQDLNRYLIASAGLIFIGLAAYVILEPDRVRRFLTGRQARYGSNALVMTIAFLGILFVGNLMAYQYPRTLLDLTEDKSNTLAPELMKALDSLPEKVTATAFYSRMANPAPAEELLSKIKSNSNGMFDYSFVDPDREPLTAQNVGITGDEKILLQMGEQTEIVAFASESEIFKGLLRLLNPGSNVVYFLIGHGEIDTSRPDQGAMTRAKSTLETKNYTVKTLNLLAENKIPEDASVIVVAGPQKPVSADEVKLLEEYLTNGGSLIVMEGPTALTEFGDAEDPLTAMLEEQWGITYNDDLVIDLDSPQPTTAKAAYYDSYHPVTVNMNLLAAYFPLARSLNIGNPANGATLTPLVQTNERSWGETDVEGLLSGGQVGLEEGEVTGPLTLAVAGEDTATGGRVVAFGTPNLAVDQIFDTYGNGDMFINAVDWAAEQEDTVGLTPKTPTERTFNVPGQFQWIAILLGSIVVIPGLVVVAGISTWLSRRRQG